MLEEAINKLVREIIDLLIGSDGFTIRAKQKGATRKQGSYADVDLLTSVDTGLEERSLVDNESDLDLTETNEVLKEMTFSLGFYRDGAIDNAEKVRRGFARESVNSILGQAGLGLGLRSAVRNVAETLENGWEDRAQFDLTIHAVGSDSDLVTSIQAVQIQGKFNTPTTEYTIAQIEVP